MFKGLELWEECGIFKGTEKKANAAEYQEQRRAWYKLKVASE